MKQVGGVAGRGQRAGGNVHVALRDLQPGWCGVLRSGQRDGGQQVPLQKEGPQAHKILLRSLDFTLRAVGSHQSTEAARD